MSVGLGYLCKYNKGFPRFFCNNKTRRFFFNLFQDNKCIGINCGHYEPSEKVKTQLDGMKKLGDMIDKAHKLEYEGIVLDEKTGSITMGNKLK